MADLWYRKDAPKIAMIYGTNPRWDSSDIELMQIAKYDLILKRLEWDTPEQKQRLHDNLKRLHDMNPRLKILHYVGGACEYYPNTKYFSEDCFLRTTEGNLINSWPGSQMLNLLNPKTIQCYSDMVDDKWAEDVGADGIYIDCMNGAFDGWAVELESKKKVKIDANGDGIEDEREELDRIWREGKTELLRSIRKNHGEEPYIVANAGMTGHYAKPYADGIILENTLDALLDQRGRLSFDEIMDCYRFWDDVKPGRVNCTYINASPGFGIEFGYRNQSFEQNCRILQRGYDSQSRMRFGLACALMGDGHYTFQLHTRSLGQHWWYQEYDIPIGKPLGNYYKHEDGTIRRDYENAIVVVNNTFHEINPHFDQTMRDGTTAYIGKDFFLPSKDGRIYVRVGL